MRKERRGGSNANLKAKEQPKVNPQVSPVIFPWLTTDDFDEEWTIPTIYDYLVEFLNERRVLPTDMATDLIHTLALNHYILAQALYHIRRGKLANDWDGLNPFKMAITCQDKINAANNKLGITPFIKMDYAQLPLDEVDDDNKVVSIEDYKPSFNE